MFLKYSIVFNIWYYSCIFPTETERIRGSSFAVKIIGYFSSLETTVNKPKCTWQPEVEWTYIKLDDQKYVRYFSPNDNKLSPIYVPWGVSPDTFGHLQSRSKAPEALSVRSMTVPLPVLGRTTISNFVQDSRKMIAIVSFLFFCLSPAL